MNKQEIKETPRIIGFDYLRAFAAFGVVWIHGSDTSGAARSLQAFTSFSVPAFVMMSFFLTTRKMHRQPGKNYSAIVIDKFKRLLPAYLGWTIVYVMARYCKKIFVQHTLLELDWISVIFYGGASYQLWFVPALILWIALFLPLIFVIIRNGNRVSAGIILLVAGIAWVWNAGFMRGMIAAWSAEGLFLHMAAHTGFVLCGIGTWLVMKRFHFINKPWFVLLSLLTGMAGLGIFAGVGKWLLPLYALGVMFIFLYGSFPVNNCIIDRIAPVAFGIFLCHGLFVEGYQLVFSFLKFDLSGFGITLMVIILSFVSSLLLCMGLRNVQATRWLVV